MKRLRDEIWQFFGVVIALLSMVLIAIPSNWQPIAAIIFVVLFAVLCFAIFVYDRSAKSVSSNRTAGSSAFNPLSKLSVGYYQISTFARSSLGVAIRILLFILLLSFGLRFAILGFVRFDYFDPICTNPPPVNGLIRPNSPECGLRNSLHAYEMIFGFLLLWFSFVLLRWRVGKNRIIGGVFGILFTYTLLIFFIITSSGLISIILLPGILITFYLAIAIFRGLL